jgi:AraC-like DNA-binding protein
MQPFLALHESRQIKTLLENSSKGLRLTASDALIEKIMGLNQIQGLDSVLTLLAILQEISQQKATKIASNTYQNVLSKKFETRINKVCTHLQIHCCEPIRLKEVADLVCMSESNFCKFFKKATSTTFSDYINDLRINEACNLLLFSDYSISEIAHASGFESLSYFNRVFLKKKQTTPSLFRKN